MPPDPVPVVRLRAAVVVVVVLRCFKLLPPARGEANLLGERVPLPTDVELAGAGCNVSSKERKQIEIRLENVGIVMTWILFDGEIEF